MRWALAALLVCSVQLAHAGRHQVLVLRAEGNADSGSRTSVDAHVMRLAKHIDGKVEAGDITLTEAAAVVGCKLSDASCKDEVLTTLGVDEIVGTTVTTTPTGLNVTVRRYTKGNAPRSAQTTLPTGKPPETKINAELGPLFGMGTATAKKPDKKPAPAVSDKTPRKEPTPATTAPTPPAPATAEPPPPPPPSTPPAPTTTPPPTTTADASTEPISSETPATTPPATPPPEGGTGTSRLPKIGMAIGGGMVVVGIILWVQAASLQGEIDNAPARNPADFARLRDLEGQADTTATFGNLFMAAGIIVGGLSTYWFFKDRRANNNNTARTARITPTVFPHGAGVAIGGGW